MVMIVKIADKLCPIGKIFILSKRQPERAAKLCRGFTAADRAERMRQETKAEWIRDFLSLDQYTLQRFHRPLLFFFCQTHIKRQGERFLIIFFTCGKIPHPIP